MWKTFVCALALGGVTTGCATADTSGDDFRVSRPGISAAAAHNLQVAGFRRQVLLGPGLQLAKHGDYLRGRVHGRAVEVQVSAELDRYRVVGSMDGMPVWLWIDGFSGPYRSYSKIEMTGYAQGRHVRLSLDPRRFDGHAGCSEFSLQSDDGVRYTGHARQGITSSGHMEVTVPRELSYEWTPEHAATALALMMTSICPNPV